MSGGGCDGGGWWHRGAFWGEIEVQSVGCLSPTQLGLARSPEAGDSPFKIQRARVKKGKGSSLDSVSPAGMEVKGCRQLWQKAVVSLLPLAHHAGGSEAQSQRACSAIW